MPDGIPSPNPDFPQQIKNVTGNANVKIQNKNLAWNGWAEDFVTRINDSSLASLTTKNGKNCLKFDRIAGYGSYDTKYLFKTNWKENTQYTISCDLFVEGSNAFANLGIVYTDGTSSDNRYNRTIDNWKNYSMTSAENKTIKYLRVEYFAGINYIDLDTFMVEENATATSYVEHQEQNYPFTFAEGQRGMQGTKLLDDGIHQKRKQIVFDGTETKWQIQKFANYIIFTIQFTDMKIANNGNGLSTHFYNYKRHNQIPGAICFGWSDNLIYFYVSTEITTIEEWKAYLTEKYVNGTPVIVEYELAESELENNIIPYNATQQAQYDAIKQATSYDDITYISSESDELGFNMNVVAVADANKVIDNLDTRLLALESEV